MLIEIEENEEDRHNQNWHQLIRWEEQFLSLANEDERYANLVRVNIYSYI